MRLVLEAYHSARWYYGKVSDDGGQAYTSQKIGEVERELGDLQTALEAYHSARWYYGKVSDDRGQAYAFQQIAEIERELGHLPTALESYHKARWYYGKVLDDQGQAYISQRMGEIEQLCGDSKQALCFFDDAYTYYRQRGDKAGEAYIHKVWGQVERAAAHWSEAQEQFERARAIYQQELKDPLAQAYLCRELGDVLLAQQQWRRARQEYDQALSFYKQEEMPDEKARIYQGRGLALRKSGELSSALHDYEEATRLSRQIGNPTGEAAAEREMLEILQVLLELERRPLPASARIKWEDSGKAFVGKKYVLQVCLGQKPPETSGGQETATKSSEVENQLIISIELDIDGSVISQVPIRYNPLKPQWIDIPFEITKAGGRDRNTLNITFIHKRCLGTISFEFQALEHLQGPISAPEQWTERQLLLPLHDKFRVDASLHIRLRDNQYTVQIISDRGATHFSMDTLTDHDVSAHSKGLQTALENLLMSVGQSNFQEKLEDLRQRGSTLWAMIFHEERAQQVIRDALKSGATIQIVVDQLERFSIPWELLYDGPSEAKEADINRFWGMRYHVIRSLSLQSQNYPPKVIQASTKPTIGVISKDSSGGAMFKAHALSNMKSGVGIEFELVHDMYETKHSDEIAYLLQFLNEKKLQILHVICHASTKDPDNSYLLIANDFHVNWYELYNRFKIQDYPLVVLNACRTGTPDPLYTSNWVTLFWKQGAGGIVATEARVPYEFAVRFSEELYKHLLEEGEQISQALFECRHHFWDEPEGHPEHNPIGLVYSLYSSPSLKIEKTV